jgi:hypothetical protein
VSVLTDAIKRLLENSDTLKQSDFPQQQRKALEVFSRNTRLIEIVKEGRSTVYRVRNRLALQSYFQQIHPLNESDLPEDLPNRSLNVGINRNSKKGKSGHQSLYLLMKAWAEGVVWQEEDQSTLPVTNATQQFGAAALQVNLAQKWSCNRSLLLVENQALFDRCDWLNASFDGCMIYYAGQISDLLLQWFSLHQRSQHVVLFPDYDGVGLSNYVRLAQAIHPDTTLEFYWLPNWQDKLVKFGDTEIWTHTRTQFENAFDKLRASGLLDERFQELAHLSQFHGKALEQESIWL